MLETKRNHLWKLLWEYDPNGLIVVDPAMQIELVNPAFCKLFNVCAEEIIGCNAVEVLEDTDDFQEAWQSDRAIRGIEKHYTRYELYLKEVIFPIRDENVIACIMTDITPEMHRKQEMRQLKTETIKKVNEVVDNQMKVVQEIAGLLGETTAETKVSLLKIIQMVNREIVE